MVLSSRVALAVVNTSANLCQYIACNPERLSNDEVLDLIFCFPFQQFRRFSLCISTFFCFPAADPLSLFSSPSSDGEDHHYD